MRRNPVGFSQAFRETEDKHQRIRKFQDHSRGSHMDLCEMLPPSGGMSSQTLLRAIPVVAQLLVGPDGSKVKNQTRKSTLILQIGNIRGDEPLA